MSRKVLLIVVGLIVTAALGAMIVSARQKSGRKWILPDGNEISLVGVTSGTRNEFVLGKRLRDHLYPLLPPKWAAKLGTRVVSQTTADTNSVVLWFRYQHAGTPEASTFPPLPCQVTVVGAGEIETEPVAGAQSVFSVAPNARLHALELRHFPHPSSGFGIRLYATDFGGKTVRLGETQVTKRASPGRVIWAPENLPSTRATNGLTVSLVSFATGLKKEHNPAALMAPEAHTFCRAIFRIADHDQPTLHWWPAIVSLSSATGETLSPAANGFRTNDLVVLDFPAALWVEESAWKMRIRLSRNHHYPPEELWHFRQIPLPAPQQIVELNARTNMFGEEVEFLGLSAPHARLPSEWSSVPGRICLHSRAPTPLPGMQFVLVDVRDNQGRPAPVIEVHQETSTGGRGATMREINTCQALDIAPGANSLDITFALSRELEVQFVARPIRLAAGGP